ncbi:insulinase family protein [Patescibacteria group bacterium]|nr:insulinase family protein [Patescibacteria group bacterium]
MNLPKSISNLYWSFKDRKLIEDVYRDSDCHFIYLPRDTKKIFIDVYIKAGALLEDERQAGIGHVLEHYISALVHKELPDDVKFGAKINDDYIVFYLESEADTTLVHAFNTLFEVLTRPDFSQKEVFDYEKRSIMSELGEEKNDIERRLERLVERTRYVDEPNGRSFVDHLPKMKELSLENIATYHKKILTKEHITIFVSAVKSHPSVLSAVTDKLDILNVSKGVPDFPRPTYSDFSIVIDEDPNLSGSYLVMTFPSLNRTASLKDEVILDLLIEIMKDPEHKGARQEMREQGIYDITVVQHEGAHNGYLAMRSYVSNDQIVAWIQIVASLMRILKESGPSQSLFERIKGEWIGDMTTHWRTNSGRFALLSDRILNQGNVPGYKKEIEEIAASATVNDVREMAKKIFEREKVNLILFGENTGLSREEIAKAMVF